MASSYVNNLRLTEIATGEESGNWGTITNTNLELIGKQLESVWVLRGRFLFLSITGNLET